MGKLAFRRPEPADVTELSRWMRPADRREIRAAFGHVGSEPQIQGYIDGSADAWACHAQGKLMCLFGVADSGQGSLLRPVGLPWMLGTAVVSANARNLLQATRAYLAEMQKDFPVLVNFIDARNAASLRYMRACGATVHEAAPYGVAGEPFHRFTLGL